MLRSSKVLEYYKSNDGEFLKGVINLEDCKMVHSDLAHKKYKFVFDIETKDRTYYLVAQTHEEMKAWVDILCQTCGLIVQGKSHYLLHTYVMSVQSWISCLMLFVDVAEFLPPIADPGPASGSTSSSGPSISHPIYATTPATTPTASTTRRNSAGGTVYSEQFRPVPDVGVVVESVYSLAHSVVEVDVQRQSSGGGGEQEVAPGMPLSEALASKGMTSGRTRISSSSSASGGDAANTSFSSDSPSFLSPRHESPDPQNLYSPVPKKTAGGVAGGCVVRPVPKPRAATMVPRGTEPPDPADLNSSLQGYGSHAGTLPSPPTRTDNGYTKPRPSNRLGNYDQLAPGPPRPANNYDQLPLGPPRPSNYDQLPLGPPRPATRNVPNHTPSPKQHHHSALLRENSAPLSTSSSSGTYVNVMRVVEEAPPSIDRSNKPQAPSPPRVDRKLKPKLSSDTRGDSLGSDSPPVFPTRTSSLANTLDSGTQSRDSSHTQSRDTNSSSKSDESPPDFPTRTTSLESSASFREEDIPRPSRRTMKYMHVEFDGHGGKPVLTADHASPSPLPRNRHSDNDLRHHPIPAPRRVNYSDVDLAATNALAGRNFKEAPRHQVTLREAERSALKEKQYVNVNKQGNVDDESDPDYYTHMRVCT